MDPDLYVRSNTLRSGSQGQFYPLAYGLGKSAVYAVYACYKFFCKDGVLDWINYHHGENIAETMKAPGPDRRDPRILWIGDRYERFDH